MDQIKIKNLRLYAHHGVYEFERDQGQPFLLSALLETDTAKAGRTDDLADTVNYAEVCTFFEEFLTQNTFSLIEAAAEQACRSLLLRFPQISAAELELAKPEAPMDVTVDSVSVHIRRSRHTAYIALGSNLGDREATLRAALECLNTREDVWVRKISALIETPPYGGVPQDNFLNSVCEAETLLTPKELLAVLRKTELAFGRTREVHWGPRTLDLDILLYDNLIMYTNELKIPHPDMHNRDFVLRPLAEIAPYAMHPILGKCAFQLLDELKL